VEPQLAAAIKANFSRARLVNLYGLSESSGACVLSPLDDPVEKVASSIGVPIGDFRVRAVDDAGRELPPGETGELVVYGDCVASGYYNLPEATRETFRSDGALLTGDMGYLEPDGHVVLRGRKKEMYVQGGFNVYPVEIENVLTQHPKVAMAAGIGVPDPVFGEVGRFYIIPRPGTQPTAEELQAYCRERLADYKVPRQFVFVE
ncbi:MAG: AMP-binding protein, partial [Firmicutes bacterium]|nr:AMP-binding protein [Bacillota bacterium]